MVNETDDFELDLQAGDIEIVGEDPMIISWGAFQQLGQQELEEYEQFRYPEIFRPFAFKSIWQKLRSLDAPPGLNVKRLLEREGDPEWSFKAFVKLVGCQASHNIEQDILYLGSDERALIDKAHRHLDSLFVYRVSAYMGNDAAWISAHQAGLKEAISAGPEASYPATSDFSRLADKPSPHLKVRLGHIHHHPDERSDGKA